MNLKSKLRVLARQGRAMLRPIGAMPDHLARHAQQTAQELGFAPDVAEQLATAARDTSRETGLIGSIQKD